MRATKPHVKVPGDNEEQLGFVRPRIMARAGDLVGMYKELAVWRFGFSPHSEAAKAYGVEVPSYNDSWPGFLWVLATRRTGKVKDTFTGYAIELPDKFRNVIEFD